MQTANWTKWEHNYNAEKSTSDVNISLFYVERDMPSCSLHFHLLSIHCSIKILFHFRLHVSHSLSFLIQSLSSTSALPGTWISNCTFYRRVCGRAWMSYDLLWFTVKSFQKILLLEYKFALLLGPSFLVANHKPPVWAWFVSLNLDFSLFQHRKLSPSPK